MDWNWFFSALAQSTAAVVGLIGAFVFTKIVNSQTAFAKDQDKLDQLKLKAEQLSDEAELGDIETYNQRLRIRGRRHLRSQLRAEKKILDPEDYYEQIWFSAFDPKEEVLEEIREEIQDFRASSQTPWGDIPDLSVEPVARQAAENRIHEQRNRISNLIVRTQDHARKIESFVGKARLNPHHSELVASTIIILFLLFLIGVIYPLGMLPVEKGALSVSFTWDSVLASLLSYRGAILLLITIGVGAVVEEFYRINDSLQFDEEDLDNLDEFSQLQRYSDHYESLREND